VSTVRKQYYFGSYGLIRGYGPLCRTFREADDSVFEDHRVQRRHGGSSDRNALVVTRATGLCWWWQETPEIDELDLVPARTADGKQARYSTDMIRGCEAIWSGPTEIAGFS
jgi:hypothetical protein